MEIVLFGNDTLRKKAAKVGEITPAVRELAEKMLHTMHDANGVGLAAEQIGREEAICVIDVPEDSEKDECRAFNESVPMPLVLVDPVITASAGKQRDSEGCLSFPDVFAQITRANEVTVEYTDINDGSRKTAVCRGLLARAVQHELDHLDGVLLVDRMSPMQRAACAGRLRRLRGKN